MQARHRLALGAPSLAPLLAAALACGGSGVSDEPPPPPPEPPPAPTEPPPAPTPAPAAPARPTCIPPAQATPSMTPVQLYPTMAACARADRPEDAFFFFALGGVYGRFDTQRVAYRSGHGATSIIRQGQIQSVPEAQWDAVGVVRDRVLDDPVQVGAFCARIRQAGRPTYHPEYMIRHGSMIFAPNTTPPLVEDFDPEAAWELSLNSYLHCDEGG